MLNIRSDLQHGTDQGSQQYDTAESQVHRLYGRQHNTHQFDKTQCFLVTCQDKHPSHRIKSFTELTCFFVPTRGRGRPLSSGAPESRLDYFAILRTWKTKKKKKDNQRQLAVSKFFTWSRETIRERDMPSPVETRKQRSQQLHCWKNWKTIPLFYCKLFSERDSRE